MKTAISIPDDLFEAAEKLAMRLKKPRSVLYAEAVAQYLARHDPDAITEAMNTVCDEVDDTADGFAREASRRVLERSEW